MEIESFQAVLSELKTGIRLIGTYDSGSEKPLQILEPTL
jgi:hypothetical protein